MLLLGFDGGGTSTRAALIRRENGVEVLARGEAGSSNHYSVGVEGVRESCRSAMNAALHEAKISREEIEGFGFGLAGACTPAEHDILQSALAPLCGSTHLVIEEDALAAQAGAFGGGAGAIVIAGTGANCFGVNENGERARADGLGPLLGDRGGGYRIGEAALRTICEAHDGVGTSTQLAALCLEKFGVQDIDALVRLVYDKSFTRDRVASLFAEVLKAAQNGDGVAQELLECAGADLARTARVVLQKLQIANVALLGGVLENAPSVREVFEKTLRAEIANLQIVTPQFDAAVGAALLVK